MMKPRPDLDNQDFIRGGQPDQVQSDLGTDRIVQISIDKLRPNVHQSRGDENADYWQKQSTIDYINELVASMKLELPDGTLYGVREALKIKQLGDDGLHEIIAGEHRWRAARLAGLKEVPCLIRAGGEKEARLDHITENSLHKGLSLWQTARAIVVNQETYGFSTEYIIAAHGLRNKSHLSKIMNVFKLSDEARALVESGVVDNVEYAYELKKLTPEQVAKFAKMVDKGTPVSQALKTISKPKVERSAKPTGEAGQGGTAHESSVVTLALNIDQAKALALKLDVDAADDVATLQSALMQRINGLV